MYRCKISNSKKFQKWTKELISRLESAWGLELEEIRKNKHLVIKGNINGIPYRQSFSTTPKTLSNLWTFAPIVITPVNLPKG